MTFIWSVILVYVVCLCCIDGVIGDLDDKGTQKKKIKILSTMMICLKSSEVSQKALSKLLADMDEDYEVYLLRSTCCNETIKYDTKHQDKIHLIEFDSIARYDAFREQINRYSIDGWYSLLDENCRNLLSNQSMINKLKNISFDFSIVQLWDGCGFIISDLLHLKRIDFVIQGLMYPQLDKMYDFIYYDSFKNKIIPKSGSDQTFEIFAYFPRFDKIRAEFNVSIKTQLQSFKISTTFVWLPEIPGYEYPNYFVPRIQFIGPIRSQRTKYINGKGNDSDCMVWLNSLPTNANVIFFSFGTLWLNMIQLKHRDLTIMKTLNIILSKSDDFYQNYYIIMKSLKSKYFNQEMEMSLMKQYDGRIKIYNSWMPQTLILNDEKVKVLVLHGGIGTLQEAMFYGVPMVSIPFEYDQPLNMEKAERIGIAYPALNVSSFTPQQLINAINEVILKLNKEYSKNAKIWANAMQIYDGKPLIKWSIYCIVNNISDLLHLPSNSVKLKVIKDKMNDQYISRSGYSAFILLISFCVILFVLLLYVCTKTRTKKVHKS